MMNEWQDLLTLLDQSIEIVHRLIKGALDSRRELDVVPTLCIELIVKNAQHALCNTTFTNDQSHNKQAKLAFSKSW